MAQAFDPGAAPLPRVHPAAISRPQVSIERLPTRRLSNEPRESMNCKSCRKRKIKCNRLRPACEACQVFQCPCIYDAVPKKRGPKTDVLEALMKRVDGLEAQLKEKNPESGTANGETSSSTQEGEDAASPLSASASNTGEKPAKPSIRTDLSLDAGESAIFSPTRTNEPSAKVEPDALLDTYFARFHEKPFYVFDESTLRQRLQLKQVPDYLMHAIYAVAARYTPHPSGYQSAVKLSEAYASQARREINTDEPSVDTLQALVLLVTAFTAAGKGKKAYMLLTNAVGMAMALELHREMDAGARVTLTERETRRRLFWTCYLLDRFMACGSKRPSLISDRTILLRLPCWSPVPGAPPIEGEFFQNGSNLQYLQGSGKKSQGSSGMLIDICRILGTTNQYLAAGGVKGDSHFPWHSLSNLSKIRQDLDVWASGTEDVFSSVESLFGQADSTVLVLSKLVYHLVHCLIYRPFLPIDLSELAGSGQHQSWQIEATNMCFLHANAVAELVELGKQTSKVEWPAFVGYCICTAGTVHIHGGHYSRHSNAREMSVFSSSAELLSREMQQLSELRYIWASVQHQRETLQGLYNAHSELVKSLANNPMRYSPAFHLEDFFDRYSNIGGPGGQTFSFDAANISLEDVVVDFTADAYSGYGLYAPRLGGPDVGPSRPNLKRKNTSSTGRKRPDLKSLAPIGHALHPLPTPTLSTASASHRRHFQPPSLAPQHSPDMLHTPTSLTSHQGIQRRMSVEHGGTSETTTSPTAALPPSAHLRNQGGSLAQALSASSSGFSPSFNFAQSHNSATEAHQGFDPMFGELPTNAFSSPTPWHGDDAGSSKASNSIIGPGDASSLMPNEEKDPFLSLLEQLAENESAMGPGTDLDFFLSGAPTTS